MEIHRGYFIKFWIQKIALYKYNGNNKYTKLFLFNNINDNNELVLINYHNNNHFKEDKS